MERLLKKLNTDAPPIQVPLKPEAYAIVENCFFNVQEKVEKDGENIIYGWKIHVNPIILEAERHAVWQSPERALIDITPDPSYTDHIHFIKDDTGWAYSGDFEDNIRVNVTNNPLVDDYILLKETITKLYQTAVRKSPTEISMNASIKNLLDFLLSDKTERERFIIGNNSVNSDCYCGSGHQYADCHGLGLNEIYASLVTRANQLSGIEN